MADKNLILRMRVENLKERFEIRVDSMDVWFWQKPVVGAPLADFSLPSILFSKEALKEMSKS